MLDFIHPKVIAAIMAVMSIGILVFWMTWSRKQHSESWMPEGFINWERSFVFPDSTMSALMAASAVLLYLGKSLGERLTLVCGGMMLFLTVIDITYCLQHDLFKKEKNGRFHLSLAVVLAMMSLVLILRFI